VTARTPVITLNNGVQLPALGLGVFQSPPAETVGAVEAAIAALDMGVRGGPDPESIDTKLFTLTIPD
jgi:diketogulonate reductase-like aldo/keto reductase